MSQEEPEKKSPQKWKGRKPDKGQINSILADHRLWIKNGTPGKPPHDLRGVDLSTTVLIKADLSWADLSGAVLRKADLTQAVLIEANLTKANLDYSNLSLANLSGAVLSEARLKVIFPRFCGH